MKVAVTINVTPGLDYHAKQTERKKQGRFEGDHHRDRLHPHAGLLEFLFSWRAKAGSGDQLPNSRHP